MNDMETKQIINWLRDKADRADNPSWTRMMHKAANRLEELEKPQKVGHWIIRSSGKGEYATNWAECSECLTCGSPQWNICPVCETRMVSNNEN